MEGSKTLFTARDILWRWVLTFVFVASPTVALMYLPAAWAVGSALICGYELRSVYVAFGEPFQHERAE